MRFRWELPTAGAAAILVLLILWFVGPIFHVTGANALVLRGGILLLGAIAIVGLLLWARSKRASISQPGTETPSANAPKMPSLSGADASGVSHDIEILAREASVKVAAARMGAGAKLSSLPVVFLVGETGSGKTSILDQSGLDAELLAGQVFQESSVVPTRTANIWFARKTLFVEAGGPLLDDPTGWVQLIRQFLPGRVRSVFSGSALGPRAAVVCVDCEKLLGEPGLDKIVAQARKLRTRLEELSFHSGVRLPVYVLFNRADRIPFFEEFAGNFSNDETAQVLGTTLPFGAPGGSGVYAEQETRRLTGSYQDMFFALAECRLGLLNRERNSVRQAAVYEFPREFGKLSKPVVQFLVDLCRPSHLRSGPFLRGFYFVGQRVTTVSVAAGQTMAGSRPAPGRFSGSATSLMTDQDLGGKTAFGLGTQLELTGETRRTVQRVFLSHVFSHVILQDRAALGTSQSSTRGDFGRRLLMAVIAGIAASWIVALVVSFVGNERLISSVRLSAQDLSSVEAPGSGIPTAESLKRLDSLRQVVARLGEYEQKGAPFRLRWGLFSGNDILEDARAIYFQYFNRILFEHTKQNLLTDLQGYHGDPQAAANAGPAYDTLKAYLLVTAESQHNRDAGAFLPDFLLREWKKDLGEVDQERTDLAAQQFSFYSSQLNSGNPYSTVSDAALVDEVRSYLGKFSGAERFYASILADARQKAKPYRFPAAHPDGLDVVRAGRDVDAAFTYSGWKITDESIRNPRRIQGEAWVLGAAALDASGANSGQQLRTTYDNEFIKQWRAFLAGAAVSGFAGDADAANKLRKLSDNSSPLLALLCDVSDNTNVSSDAIKQAFQAVQQVVAPGCGLQRRYLQPSNDAYMKGLLALQACVQDLANAPADQKDAKREICGQSAEQALLAAGQIKQGLTNDPEGHVDKLVGALLEEPIKSWQVRSAGAGSGTAVLCAAFHSVQSLYPFSAHGREATLQEVNGFFQPAAGKFSQFLSTQKNIVLQGLRYARVQGASSDVGNNFLRFVNGMYSVQRAIYPNNSPDARYEYTVTAYLPEVGGFKSGRLNLDGQELAVTTNANSRKFTWPSSGAQTATLNLNQGGGDLEYQRAQGLWAVAHFFGDYKWQPIANGYTIQGVLRGPTGQPVASNGRPVEVRFDVDFKNVPLFQPGFLSPYSCPAKISQ